MEEIKIIPGSLEELSDLLIRANGSSKIIKEAIRQHGYRSLWLAALNNAVNEKSKIPRFIDGYPPKIFISYRWGDDSLMDWVARLACGLKENGFTVYLDQHELDENPLPVVLLDVLGKTHNLVMDAPNYISNLAVSDYCINIVTKEYCHAVGVYGETKVLPIVKTKIKKL